MFTTNFETLKSINLAIESILKVLRGKHGYLYLFLLLACSVAVSSWFDPYGGLSLDAPWYLKLSQSLADGCGFNVLSPDYKFYDKPHYMYLWPPLYSIGIACIAKATTLPVWISYKILNLLLILFVFKQIYKHFNENGFYYVSIFFTAYILDMSYQCWSEMPMICILSLYFIQLAKLDESNQINWRNMLLIIVLNLLLVGIRYQAIIALLALIPFIIKFFKAKRQYEAYILLFTLIFLILVESLFIYFNFILHNKIVYQVPFDLKAAKELIATVFYQLVKQLNFLFSNAISAWYLLPISLMMGYLLIKQKPTYIKLSSAENKTSKYAIILISILYLTIPILMRIGNAVGLAHDRFYTVSMFCIIWASIALFSKSKLLDNKIMLMFIGLSWSINTIGKYIYINQVLHQEVFIERFERLEKKYAKLPSNTSVAFADKWIEFIRPDIISVSPYEKVMGPLSEPMDSFLCQVKRHRKNIYIEIIPSENQRVNRYDVSVKNYMLKNRKAEFVIE